MRMRQQQLLGAKTRNLGFVGHTSLGGRIDCAQVMVEHGFAYVAHIFSHGFTVVDVRDPREPRPIRFVPSMKMCWSGNLQAHGDLLFVSNTYDPLQDPTVDEPTYYGKPAAEFMKPEERSVGGLQVYDISNPGEPREIGEMRVEGKGIHRSWYAGGDFAYSAGLLEGYCDSIFMVVDVRDPSEPSEVGRWWIPGMWSAGGETPSWSTGDRYALHHPIIAHDIAYASWRDGGLTLLDVKDPSRPALISHSNWNPPFGGGTHTALPLTDRVPQARPYVVVLDEGVLDNCADGVKHTWIIDVREPQNPINISTFPVPSDDDYCSVGGHFGPHNAHENRPGAFQSSEVVFVTYQNAGLRVFDVRDVYRPREIGHFVPPPPTGPLTDPRPNRPSVVQTHDVFVAEDGLVYITDLNSGMYILQWEGE
jgi:hypothetical protein